MRPAAVGQCNTVPAPHGDIYSASSFLRNLNFFPALTFGAILPATPQLLPGVPSSSTLCHFLRAPAACIPRRCTATPLPMQLLPLILAYKLLTDPFSSLLLILHFQLFHTPAFSYFPTRSGFSNGAQEVFVSEVLTFFTLFPVDFVCIHESNLNSSSSFCIPKYSAIGLHS